MTEQYKDNLGPLAYWPSKIIEYTDGKQVLVKDKKRDIESSTGVVMHFTHAEVKMLESELRMLSRLKGKAMSGALIQSVKNSVARKTDEDVVASMKDKDFTELVLKLVSQGKNYLEAVKMAENSGLFDKKIIDDFWTDFNEKRKSQ